MKRYVNGKALLAAASVCAVTAALVCVNIDKETKQIVQTDLQMEQETAQEIESQEEVTQDVTNLEVQQVDKTENKEKESKEEQQETYIPRNWSVGTIEASRGENEYTKVVLDATVGEVPEFWTFAYKKEAVEPIDISFERAFVIAGEKQADGLIQGSLWYASKENCQLVAQNIVLKDAQATYFTMGVHKDCYLILDDENDNGTQSYIWRYTDTRPELFLSGIEGKKEVAEYGLICYKHVDDGSCMITQTDDETIYAWTGRSEKPYYFQFGEAAKIRGVNTKVITQAQLQELEQGTTIINQIKKAFPQEDASEERKYTMQYLLRENNRLDVNIGIEYEDSIDFQYMSFDTQSGICMEQGSGFYLIQMTGDAAVQVFQKCFMGEGHILPMIEDALPMHMQATKYSYKGMYEPKEDVRLQTLKEENIYGVEFAPQGELKQCLEGLVWNCSTEDTWLPWVRFWFDFYDEYGSREEARSLAVIGQTNGFDIYAVHGPFGQMMVQTPDEKYVWIDYNSTCNYGGQPEVFEVDFDKDGTKELLITGLCAGHGTGVNVATMLMLDQNEKKEWMAYMIPYDWYQKELASYIETTHDENGMQLWIDGEAVGKPVDVKGDTTYNYDGSQQIAFYYDEYDEQGEGKIYLSSDLLAYSDTSFVGDYGGREIILELEYIGYGKWKAVGCDYQIYAWAEE